MRRAVLPAIQRSSNGELVAVASRDADKARTFAGELGIPLRGRSGIAYVPDFYGQWDGETHPEQVTVSSFLRIVAEASRYGVAEVSCHPGRRDPAFRSLYDGERDVAENLLYVFGRR